MNKDEKQQILQTITKIREILNSLESSIENKFISEETYCNFTNLRNEVGWLTFLLEFKLDFFWRLFQEESEEK